MSLFKVSAVGWANQLLNMVTLSVHSRTRGEQKRVGRLLGGDPRQRLSPQIKGSSPEADGLMRILHIIGSVDPASGGPIEGVLRQHEALINRGSREIVSLDSPAALFLQHSPIPVHAMGPPIYKDPGSSRLRRFGYTPRLVPWLKAHVRDYDIVVVNGLWNYGSVGASLVLPGSGVPYFVYTHGMMDPWFRKTYPWKHLQKQASWLAFEGRLMQGASAVLFTTEEEKKLADGQFWGYHYNPVVAGYGTAAPPAATPSQIAAFREQMPSLGQRPYLLFLSRIHRKKGCDLLVEAFARCAADFPDVDLVIAGPDRDGLVPKYRARAEALGIAGRIHWPGMVTGDSKWGGLRGALAFILPSHQENFGIAVAEALACGVPVMTTDKVNIWREVEAGGAGLIATDTVDGIEGLLRRMLALSPEARALMGDAGVATYKEYFDVNTTAMALYNYALDLLSPERRQEMAGQRETN